MSAICVELLSSNKFFYLTNDDVLSSVQLTLESKRIPDPPPVAHHRHTGAGDPQACQGWSRGHTRRGQGLWVDAGRRREGAEGSSCCLQLPRGRVLRGWRQSLPRGAPGQNERQQHQLQQGKFPSERRQSFPAIISVAKCWKEQPESWGNPSLDMVKL